MQNEDSYMPQSTVTCYLCFIELSRYIFEITFVLEHIMSITGDTTKDHIGVFGVPFVDFLGLHIKPVLIIAGNVVKMAKTICYLKSQTLVML